MSRSVTSGAAVTSEHAVRMLEELRVASLSRHLSHVEQLNLRLLGADEHPNGGPAGLSSERHAPVRVAIVSLLFNWPSTAGGIVHTAELATFLSKAGYEVCHFFAVFEPWQIGQVAGKLPYRFHAIEFAPDDWSIPVVKDRFRKAIDQYLPDCVIITDSWNSKPHLANAMEGYPYFLRLAALECICPLNNVRLLLGEDGAPKQCHRTQLATPLACQRCVDANRGACGPLHQNERAFAQFASPNYAAELSCSFENAAGVLAVNPLIAALCEPYTQKTHVIPSGFDPERFRGLPAYDATSIRFRLLFAGIANEYMKGFHVLMRACQELWKVRQDFELHVTADSSDTSFRAPFLEFRQWQSQDSLASLMAECHAVVVPTIAQEALGRTAVEAMGASRAVIASRLGGLPFTVTEGHTGLLVEPANPAELAGAIARLLDDRATAKIMGDHGREKFDREFAWDAIIEKRYRQLFEEVRTRK